MKNLILYVTYLVLHVPLPNGRELQSHGENYTTFLLQLRSSSISNSKGEM